MSEPGTEPTDGGNGGGEAARTAAGFTRIIQIGIVVRDLDAAMRRYADIGIGPWQVYTFGPDDVTEWREHGQPVARSSRFAVASVGDVDWELIEPVDADSLHAAFLREKGEGVHHIAVGVRDYDETLAAHAAQGHSPVLTAEVSGVRVAYLDTERDLGVVLEVADLSVVQ